MIPWQVALKGPKSGQERICGGAIISPKTVLTAAHCIINTVGADWAVTAGHIKNAELAASHERGFQKRNVKTVIVHP